MKTYYTAYHIIYNNREDNKDDYILYKNYIREYTDYNKNVKSEIKHSYDFLYKCNDESEFIIYLNLLGLNFKDEFKPVGNNIYDQMNFKTDFTLVGTKTYGEKVVIRYDTDYI